MGGQPARGLENLLLKDAALPKVLQRQQEDILVKSIKTYRDNKRKKSSETEDVDGENEDDSKIGRAHD